MNCNSFEELIALHAEGDLESSQAISVELHLKSCASCQRFLAELKASQALVKELAEESLDPASFNVVRQRVMQAVNRRQAARPIWWRFLPPALAEWRPAWAAALVALVALGFLLQWQLWRGRDNQTELTLRESVPHRMSERKARTASPANPPRKPDLGQESRRNRQRGNSPSATCVWRLTTSSPTGSQPEVAEDEPPVEQGSNLEPEQPPPADVPAEPPPPLVIKLVTDDPNIVIVWLVDQEVQDN